MCSITTSSPITADTSASLRVTVVSSAIGPEGVIQDAPGGGCSSFPRISRRSGEYKAKGSKWGKAATGTRGNLIISRFQACEMAVARRGKRGKEDRQ